MPHRLDLADDDCGGAELDKNFGQKTAELKGSEMDIRGCAKENLDAIDKPPTRLESWSRPSKQGFNQLLLRPPEQLEMPITEEPTREFPN